MFSFSYFESRETRAAIDSGVFFDSGLVLCELLIPQPEMLMHALERCRMLLRAAVEVCSKMFVPSCTLLILFAFLGSIWITTSRLFRGHSNISPDVLAAITLNTSNSIDEMSFQPEELDYEVGQKCNEVKKP